MGVASSIQPRGESGLPIHDGTDSWSSTDFRTIDFSYKWTIQKFQIHCDNSQVKMLESPVFNSGCANDPCKWRLRVYLREANQSQQCGIRLGLLLLEGGKNPVLVTTRLGILDKDQDWMNQTKYVTTLQKEQCVKKGELSSARLTDVSSALKVSNGLLCDGNLTVFCTVKVYLVNDIVHMDSSGMAAYSDISESKDLKCLSHDLGSLLQQGLCSDVTIVAGGKEFKAHKGILSARSQVFRAMFEHNMEESLQNRVTIEDLKSDVVQEMLTFIYTGKAPNLGEMTESLFSTADRYALEQLKLLCERELARQLNVQNAAEILILADRHNATKLKSNCIDFIAAHAVQVMDSQGWSKLDQYRDLTTGVMRKLAGNPSSTSSNSAA